MGYLELDRFENADLRADQGALQAKALLGSWDRHGWYVDDEDLEDEQDDIGLDDLT